MGFIRANTIPILKEHNRRPFSGSQLSLGQPDVYFNYELPIPQQGVYKRDPRWVQDSKQFRDECSKSARVVGGVKHGLKQLISKLVS